MYKNLTFNDEETLKYFDYIKETLKNKVNEYNVFDEEISFVDYVFCIPFRDIDEVYLKELCENAGIKMWYSSSNDREGVKNPCPFRDKLNFSQKTSDIIINSNLKLVRRKIG